MKKLVLAVAMMVAAMTANAKYNEVQTVTLNNPTIHHGTTRNGNDKWYIVISDGANDKNVAVSKGNADASQIVLVKWVDDETGKVKYSTRSVGGRSRKSTPDFDLSKISSK